MQKLLVGIVVVILILGLVGSSYAAYNGVGLVTSGQQTTGTSNSRGVFFVFPGGGPGAGK
ncbi:MAG: hypothetical protein WBC91_20895 [Phototrophicaceae bacterium]